MFIFFARERKRVFVQQKAENCSFVQKRRNFVTGLLIVYVVTGQYKVTFSYENKTKTWARWHARVVRNRFFRLIKIQYLNVLASFKSVLYPDFILTSFLWINKIRLKFLQNANKALDVFTTKITTFGSRALVLCIFRAYFSPVVVFVVWIFIT